MKREQLRLGSGLCQAISASRQAFTVENRCCTHGSLESAFGGFETFPKAPTAARTDGASAGKSQRKLSLSAASLSSM